MSATPPWSLACCSSLHPSSLSAGFGPSIGGISFTKRCIYMCVHAVCVYTRTNTGNVCLSAFVPECNECAVLLDTTHIHRHTRAGARGLHLFTGLTRELSVAARALKNANPRFSDAPQCIYIGHTALRRQSCCATLTLIKLISLHSCLYFRKYRCDLYKLFYNKRASYSFEEHG